MAIVSRCHQTSRHSTLVAHAAFYHLLYYYPQQGCTAIKQWNGDADGDEDVKIATKSLVRFRLCPEETCQSSKAAGCTAGYGDYIIALDTFMDSYFEAVRQQSEYECEQFLENQCACEDNGDDNYNEEYCQYDCLNDAGMYECIENNPYQEDEDQEEVFELDEYMECRELNIQNDNRRRRRAEEEDRDDEEEGEQDQQQEEEEEEEIQYFVGPYCSNEGGEVFLGLFTDDTCSTKADDVTFKQLMGFSLPYESTSIVDADCVSCLEPQDAEDNNNGNDAEDADAVSESCEFLYKTAGKCESNLPSGMVAYPNENACNYMEGISIVRKDGIIDIGQNRPSAVATAFIVISAMAFCAMAFYVWYLRTRLGVKKDTLL